VPTAVSVSSPLVARFYRAKLLGPLAGVVLDAHAHQVAELIQPFVGERVAGEVTLLLPGHEPSVQQHAQMLGDVPLLHPRRASINSETVNGSSISARDNLRREEFRQNAEQSGGTSLTFTR
jgi:hypothetical protein